MWLLPCVWRMCELRMLILAIQVVGCVHFV